LDRGRDLVDVLPARPGRTHESFDQLGLGDADGADLDHAGDSRAAGLTPARATNPYRSDASRDLYIAPASGGSRLTSLLRGALPPGSRTARAPGRTACRPARAPRYARLSTGARTAGCGAECAG